MIEEFFKMMAEMDEIAMRQRMAEEKDREAAWRLRRRILGGKLIFNGRDTVLKVGDETYVARCEERDRYDREKGLAMCILKAMGFNASDLLKFADRGIEFTAKKEPKTIKGDKAVGRKKQK